MSSDPLVLDPEFEELLREIALDPDSTLLRVPRPKVVRGFFERDEAVRESATFLTRAERHLVQVHRNELAWLLREVCLYKLVEGPESRLYVSHHGPAGQDCSPLKPSAWKEHLQLGLGEAVADEHRVTGIELVLRCVQRPLADEPRVAELAAASHRLQPTSRARLLAAIDLCHRDAPRTGLQIAQFVLDAQPGSEQATRAWECAGFALGKLDRLGEAHQAYKRGCAVDDAHTLMNRLVFALQIADQQDAFECARRLNDILSADSLAVAYFVETRRLRRDTGEWAPTAVGRGLAKSMRDTLDGAARRIVHVLF